MFAAAVLGGIGQPMGALFGGLIVGIVEELSTFPWFSDQALISPDYKAAISFGILVLLLIFKPTGLFRGRLL
jgi:branched-subunit amino acid ABC-type transport system permease component